MKQQSLTTRAVVVALSAQFFCAAVLCTAALWHEFHIRMHALDVQIQGSADSLLGAVQDAEDPDSNVTLDPSEVKLPNRDVFAVYNQGGRLLGQSTNAPAMLIARAQEGFRDIRLRGEKYRVFQRDGLRVIDRAEYSGVGLRRPVTLVYAAPEGHLRHEVFEAASFYIVIILLGTGAMAFALPALLRRTLLPLNHLASAAAEIKPPVFPFNPPASAVQLAELRPLTEALNRSIIRVRASFAREHRFVSDAAHELKTAIAVVRSSAQLLLLKSRTETEYRAGVERVVDDVERMESLIGQMLQLARVEEDAGGDVPVTDLAAVAQQTAAALSPVAERRGISVRVTAAANMQVRLRRESAETLLSNLLLNAIQHSTPDSNPVFVSVAANPAGQVELDVTDGGCGISPEAVPHIFDRFYREDTSRSRETGGTGLGLAIVKSVVEAAHGNITVQSTPGVGTTMRVIFMPA